MGGLVESVKRELTKESHSFVVTQRFRYVPLMAPVPKNCDATMESLVGIGLYTPSEASRLIHVSPGKIIRWLRGHEASGRGYARLWQPQIELGDGHVYLGFRDLMEARVADAFIHGAGLSPQKVRRAILIAREMIGEERPLSTARFRTDGRTVFLQVVREDGSAKLIDLFRSQYGFREIIEPTFRNVEFDDQGIPARWWPAGCAARIVVDPLRSFGHPIDEESSVPTAVLAAAALAEGSEARAARVWAVPVNSIRRARKFETGFEHRKAA